MELVIDFDNINDSAKKEWLIHTLRLLGIDFHTRFKPQTLEEYNQEMEAGDEEIESGKFITASELKKDAAKW